ncbi:MAG TPA: response regulator [Bacteroidia bacterium]|nr:response regulator [Bacteroidia bacterium]
MKTNENINHILVIDDDEFLLHAMRKKLELANYRVTISNNVHDAYFKLNMIKPDLIILDIIMPDINGIEFMYLINSQLMTLNIPIILMSYLSKKDLYNMGYNIGAAHYLAKPFDINKLPLMLKREIFHA